MLRQNIEGGGQPPSMFCLSIRIKQENMDIPEKNEARARHWMLANSSDLYSFVYLVETYKKSLALQPRIFL